MRTKIILVYFFCLPNILMGNNISFNIDLLGNNVATIQLEKQDSFPIYVFLPFQIVSETQLEYSQDVHIKLLATNINYSILHINANDKTSVNFKVKSAKKLSQNSEGEALFELDLSYQFLSILEKKLYDMGNALKCYDLEVILPKEYGEKSTTISGFETNDNRIYTISEDNLKRLDNCWIVFPNPITKSNNIINFFLAFIAGCFLLLINVPALKRRNLTWSISVLALSIIILVSLFFLTQIIPFYKLLVAGVLPNVLYGFIVSVYLIIDRFFAVNIFGCVYVDNFPRRIIDLEIHELKNGTYKLIKKVDRVKEGGNFKYYLKSSKRIERTFKINASLNETKQFESEAIKIFPGKSHEETITL